MDIQEKLFWLLIISLSILALAGAASIIQTIIIRAGLISRYALLHC